MVIRKDLHHSGSEICREVAEQLVLLFRGNPGEEVGGHGGSSRSRTGSNCSQFCRGRSARKLSLDVRGI